MRKSFICAVLASVMFTTAASADGEYPPSGLYASGQGGFSFLTNADVSSTALAPFTAELEFDTGFNLGAAVGYRSKYGFRVEGEYSYRAADIDSICVSGLGCGALAAAGASGDVSAHSLMANFWWEPDLSGGRILPYAGGGVGVSFMSVDASATGTSGSSDATAFTYQLGAGVGYALTPDLVGFIDYRWLAAPDADFDGIDVDLGSHNLSVGLRYHF